MWPSSLRLLRDESADQRCGYASGLGSAFSLSYTRRVAKAAKKRLGGLPFLAPKKPRVSAIELSERYGELFREVKEAFLHMPHDQLEVVLAEYRRAYGKDAHEHAVKSLPKWRTGLVRMQGATMVRLLELVPLHLPLEGKMLLVKSVRQLAQRRRGKARVCMSLPADGSLNQAFNIAVKLVRKQIEIGMPEGLTEIEGWLYQDDIKALQQVLVEQEREMLYAQVADLYWNLKLAQWLRTGIRGRMVAQVRFEIPTAHVIIEVRRPRRTKPVEVSELSMQDQDVITQIMRAESDSRYAEGQMTAQEYVLRNIDRYFSPQQQEELRLIAAKQGLELDKMKTEVVMRGQSSAHDVEQFKKLLDDLKKSGARADVEGNYQTPSGSVSIKAKTNALGCSTLLFGVLMLTLLLALL